METPEAVFPVKNIVLAIDLMLEAPTSFLHEWSHENMRLYVVINLWILNWDCSLCLTHLRQEIPQNLFCCQNIHYCYVNLSHLMDLFLLPSWIPSTLLMRQPFFPWSQFVKHHHYKHLFVWFPFICQWHCSCLSLYIHKEPAATVCPQFVVKDTSFIWGK